MMYRRKLLVVVFCVGVFLFSTVGARPSDDGAEVVSDEDATIQNNPNYTATATEEADGQAVDASAEKTEKAEEDKHKNVVEADEDTKEEGKSDLVETEEENTVTKDDKDMEDDEVTYFSDSDSDDDYDVEDEYDYDEEEDEPQSKDTVKRVLAQALSKSRKVPRRTIKFVKNNRVKLTIAAALFAFRKEIGRIAYHILTKPKTVDPETGRVLTRTINLSPTSILKIILFIDLMRKLNSGEISEPGPLGSKGSFLFKLLQPSNTAFVPPTEQHWTFEKVNERYDKDKMAFQKAMGTPNAALGTRKKPMGQSLRSFATNTILGNTQDEKQDLVILLDWTKLTESIDQMNSLRDQVSFLLSQHRAKNGATPVSNTTSANITDTTEIIVILESPGGAAADYGLAAQMMLRLSHEPGLIVTVCVDKVAASGGYMIACASSPGRLYAAPFSVLGSIGVVGSAINIHNVLEGWGVKPLVFRGGKNKAPVGLIGEVTKDGIKQVQNMVDATHVAFKRHVVAARPSLSKDINKLATGKVWLGYEALNVGLIDRIITSDEYIGERLLEGARVLRLVKYNKPRFLFPSHPSRLSVLNPMNVIRKTARAMMVEFARAVQQTSSMDGIPLVATDPRLTAAATSLGTSMKQPICVSKVP